MHRAWAACDCTTIFDQPRRVFVLGKYKVFFINLEVYKNVSKIDAQNDV